MLNEGFQVFMKREFFKMILLTNVNWVPEYMNKNREFIVKL
ncbi:17758_t:CDS:2 [Rhizophagus irregularis]|nr:17758_t:CDS:2 [Rhizophagus irregularis]